VNHNYGRICALVLLSTALSGCKSGLRPAKPLAQLTPTERSGHAVYSSRCGACHYDRIDAPLNGPSLAGVFQKPYLSSGAPANDERVTNTIQHGRNNMPALGDTISPEETADLLAYLHTL